jgi:hypothetical protein
LGYSCRYGMNGFVWEAIAGGLTALIGNNAARSRFRDAPANPQSVLRSFRPPPHSSLRISGLSYKTAFRSELWTSIFPL